ncbi:hypothetical protein HELRODRAFT_165417 [Helobdella robusta]|uniref:C2H2-type domain-containing protein n=1 Tax=Helobdella robusta TaxID=6412 RepID=T1EWR3_HELRO|nr:hypothetical protein HELRODRAFT_165417 [Helobdella robusta]ESN91388.1 hypothetical protein HELRODRAFT_165417 [Helobdella robusta]
MTHSTKKPYECQFTQCDKSYCDARSLRRHHENHHQQLLENHPLDYTSSSGLMMGTLWSSGYNPLDEPKPVKCSVCGKRFRNMPALNGHMRLHGGYTKQIKAEIENIIEDVSNDEVKISLQPMEINSLSTSDIIFKDEKERKAALALSDASSLSSSSSSSLLKIINIKHARTKEFGSSYLSNLPDYVDDGNSFNEPSNPNLQPHALQCHLQSTDDNINSNNFIEKNANSLIDMPSDTSAKNNTICINSSATDFNKYNFTNKLEPHQQLSCSQNFADNFFPISPITTKPTCHIVESS